MVIVFLLERKGLGTHISEMKERKGRIKDEDKEEEGVARGGKKGSYSLPFLLILTLRQTQMTSVDLKGQME